MSKTKRRLKAQKREAFWGKRNVGPNGKNRRPCPNCGEPGPHFVPPSLGDPGQYICASKRNAQDWAEAHKVHILDPDGWRPHSILGEKDMDELIDEEEFIKRLSECTVGPGNYL